jgi:hypothetical protein
MYDEVADDPKIQTLGDKLGFFWMNCLCLASRNGGTLPELSEISWRLHKAEASVASMLSELQARGLMEVIEGEIHPHNWNGRQFENDVSTERVKRFRKRHETVSETAPDTESDTDTETEQTQTAETAPPVSARAAVQQIRTPKYKADELFLTWKYEYEQTGAPFIEVDWTYAHDAWKILDFEQKQAVMTGFRSQIAAGRWADPARVMKPCNYIRDGEYKRAPPASPRTRQQQLADDWSTA